MSAAMVMTMAHEDVLTLTKAARFCRMKVRTFRQAVADDRIPHRKRPGGRALFLREDLQAWIRGARWTDDGVRRAGR